MIERLKSYREVSIIIIRPKPYNKGVSIIQKFRLRLR